MPDKIKYPSLPTDLYQIGFELVDTSSFRQGANWAIEEIKRLNSESLDCQHNWLTLRGPGNFPTYWFQCSKCGATK